MTAVKTIKKINEVKIKKFSVTGEFAPFVNIVSIINKPQYFKIILKNN